MKNRILAITLFLIISLSLFGCSTATKTVKSEDNSFSLRVPENYVVTDHELSDLSILEFYDDSINYFYVVTVNSSDKDLDDYVEDFKTTLSLSFDSINSPEFEKLGDDIGRYSFDTKIEDKAVYFEVIIIKDVDQYFELYCYTSNTDHNKASEKFNKIWSTYNIER